MLQTSQAQHAARLRWVNDAVIPESCTGIVGMTLSLEVIKDWLFKDLLVLC